MGRKNNFFPLKDFFLDIFYAIIHTTNREIRESFIMKKIISTGLILASIGGMHGAYAQSDELAQALQAVRTNCGGISATLNKMKTMAGINTAVTGVGTVSAGVALGTGIAKSVKDEEFDQLLESLYTDLEKQTQIEKEVIDADEEAIDELIKSVKTNEAERENIIKQLNELYEKSKKLGNIRTGTLAAATATSIAGAAIAGTNTIDEDFATKIGACAGSVKALANVKMIATVDGSAEPEQITQADKIISACGQFETVDLSSINKRATGAAVSSGIGAGLGLAGTITSAVANTDKTRAGDQQKEKNLNTAANVLAGGTTAASLTSTIFNATQIAAIKRASTVADECEGALK